MTRKGVLAKVFGRFTRKKQEIKPELNYRRKGEIAIDISGLSPESQRNILKAFAEQEKESKRRGSE